MSIYNRYVQEIQRSDEKFSFGKGEGGGGKSWEGGE